MKPTPRMRKILLYLLFFSTLFGRDSYTYVYLLPFDNIQNDPAVEWIAAGLTDMVSQELNNNYGIRLKTKDDLEIIMNDRALMLKQPRGSRNLLVLGKYNRQLDNILVSIQIVDVATWEELGTRQITEVYTQIPSLNKAVGTVINQLISPYLPTPPVAKVSPFPTFSEPKVTNKRHPISVQSEKVASNLDQQLADLEASMDILLGARQRKKENVRTVNSPKFKAGEWSMDFDVDQKVEDNPENAGNTQMLSKVLDQLLSNPYDVELQRPEFEYHEDDELYMTVRFPVVYKLKDKIIKDMLETLPYTGLEQNGSLTIFYFDKTSFNFPEKHVESIKSGTFRIVPIMRIFDQNRNTLIIVADTPESYWHSRTSDKVLYSPQHQFSPLIDFAVGGWSMQIAMETVEIQAIYEFILPVSEVESLSNVSLKFVNEDELKLYLDPIL
jgi:TolB-like protein